MAMQCEFTSLSGQQLSLLLQASIERRYKKPGLCDITQDFIGHALVKIKICRSLAKIGIFLITTFNRFNTLKSFMKMMRT